MPEREAIVKWSEHKLKHGYETKVHLMLNFINVNDTLNSSYEIQMQNFQTIHNRHEW